MKKYPDFLMIMLILMGLAQKVDYVKGINLKIT